MNFPFEFALHFFLIMARLAGLIGSAPIFSDNRFFHLGKFTFVFFLTALLAFVVPMTPNLPNDPFQFVLLFVMQFMVGMMIGFLANLLVISMEFAGTLMDNQAGLSVAATLNPGASRGQITPISHFINFAVVILFLQVNGHHLVLTTVVNSFKLLPIDGIANMEKAGMHIVTIARDIFMIGTTLAAPILLVVFLIDFAFGMLNKVAEQVNVFQLGFQVKPSLSLLIVLAAMPGLVDSVFRILERLSEHILTVLIMMQV